MTSVIAAGLVLLTGQLAPPGLEPKTIVVLGTEPGAADDQPSRTPLTLERRVQRLEAARYTIRSEGAVVYAYSPTLWPEKAMSTSLASIRMLAGRLQPGGLLDLKDQADFKATLSAFLERTSGVVISPDSALALESSQMFTVTSGDRTIHMGMSAHALPQETRMALQSRPLRASAKTIDERLGMTQQDSPVTVVVPMLRSVSVEVFGDGWDKPTRRLELFGNATGRMAQEVAQFRSQFGSAYEDLTRTMVTNGLAPQNVLPGPAPFASMPADIQAHLRTSARSAYLNWGFDTAEAAEAFVERATRVNVTLRIVVVGSELASPGRQGAIVGVAISRP
jgi:hypothetical protein